MRLVASQFCCCMSSFSHIQLSMLTGLISPRQPIIFVGASKKYIHKLLYGAFQQLLAVKRRRKTQLTRRDSRRRRTLKAARFDYKDYLVPDNNDWHPLDAGVGGVRRHMPLNREMSHLEPWLPHTDDLWSLLLPIAAELASMPDVVWEQPRFILLRSAPLSLMP